jgi:hypothetical protein
VSGMERAMATKPQAATWQLDEPQAAASASGKLALTPALAARLRGCSGDIAATVKVAEAGYVPAAARLRMRIGPCLFTADIPAARLAELEADAAVISIQPASRLRSPEAG